MKRFQTCLLFALLFIACNHKKQNALFTLLASDQTGIDFQNTIIESDTLNALNFNNIYNGSGVGVGDFNNDGLSDIFFAANMVSSRLYLNKGELHFTDVTALSGLTTSRWINGVAVIDINQDGWKDVYLCTANRGDSNTAGNLLFLNKGLDSNGIPQFEEKAHEYGIDDKAYSVQSAFFDYDRDGDLDIYLLNNGIVKDQSNYAIRPKSIHGESLTTDHLYRNDGPFDHPHFTDVSKEAGIQTEGYGLGVAISDLNKDGWPDIYVSNDYISSDFLWINNGNGTFTDKNNLSIQHTSLNGMGVDIGDFNNDCWPDIIQLDMLPPDNYRKKMMLGKSNYNSFLMKLSLGYQAQYIKNTLQLNNGIGPDSLPSFSEISQLAGVSSTDWSWAPLFADFDNDGWKDLFISNGYRRDLTDLDFIVYDYKSKTRFGTKEYIKSTYKEQLEQLPEIKISNYIFSNNRNLTFTDKTHEWGLQLPSFSAGAAYADLDNDGDVELIVSVIDGPALIYKNELVERNTEEKKEAGNNVLQIILNGDTPNREGIGTKLKAISKGASLFYEHFLSRGYLSSMDNKILLGLGNINNIDSLIITWPDQKKQILLNVSSKSKLVLKYEDAKDLNTPAPTPNTKYLFNDVTAASGMQYVHNEAEYIDFKDNSLIPYKTSQNGPCIAKGDINGDGLEDVFVGGSNEELRYFFLQQENETFQSRSLPVSVNYEDVDAVFFDADNDKDLDLYVVSGSTEYPVDSDHYQDRLYINDGKANFTERNDLIPVEHNSGSCVAVTDYNKDGDLDLFVGGKTIPGKYPFAASGFLLRNDKGHFVNATVADAPDILSADIVNAAVWADINNDGTPDLITAGEFSNIELYSNKKGKLHKEKQTGDLSITGWWTSLVAADMDMDGDMDLVAGNIGYNSPYKANDAEPLRIFGLDVDKNGTIEPIIALSLPDPEGNRVLFPEATLDQMSEQFPVIRKTFNRYHAFAGATLSDILPPDKQNIAYQRSITNLASMYFENLGKNKFKASILPVHAQFAPIMKILIDDINGDAKPDIVAGGNSYAWDSRNGYMDASIGAVFTGNGKGQFNYEPYSETGFFVKGAIRSMVNIRTADHSNNLVVGCNRGSIKVFKPKNKTKL